MPPRAHGPIDALDLLRGLAVLLMVVNHAGVVELGASSQPQGIAAGLVFVGSFAPVLFFFATGFGIGVSQAATGWPAMRSALFKAALLLLADQFLFWRAGHSVGLDFLGFIALSTILVTAVRLSARPVAVCAGLIALTVLLRFAIGVWLRGRVASAGPIAWLLGVEPVENVSYPFSPWMVFPLLGFVCARAYRAGMPTWRAWRWPAAAVVAALAASLILQALHASFFRWGLVSGAFFVLSLGVLGIAVGTAWWIAARWPRGSRLLSLRGSACFAAVPIHYALIQAVVALGGGVGAEGAIFIVLAAALVVLTVALSKAFGAAAAHWMTGVTAPLAAVPLLACVLLAWLLPAPSLPAFLVFVAGQLAVAALLAVRGQRHLAPSGVKPALPQVP